MLDPFLLGECERTRDIHPFRSRWLSGWLSRKREVINKKYRVNLIEEHLCLKYIVASCFPHYITTFFRLSYRFDVFVNFCSFSSNGLYMGRQNRSGSRASFFLKVIIKNYVFSDFILIWLDLTSLDLTSFVLTWLYFTWFYLTHLTWLYLTSLHLTSFNFPWLHLILLDFIGLDLAWLDLTWLRLTSPHFT